MTANDYLVVMMLDLARRAVYTQLDVVDKKTEIEAEDKAISPNKGAVF